MLLFLLIQKSFFCGSIVFEYCPLFWLESLQSIRVAQAHNLQFLSIFSYDRRPFLNFYLIKLFLPTFFRSHQKAKQRTLDFKPHQEIYIYIPEPQINSAGSDFIKSQYEVLRLSASLGVGLGVNCSSTHGSHLATPFPSRIQSIL